MENKTLGNKASEDLLKLIQDKGYAVGEKLPNEYELSAILGVSRNTVREALHSLASRNVLDISQGAGTFISEKMGVADDPLGFSFVEDRRKLVKDLIQIRCIIEPQIASLAAQNATEEELIVLEKICTEIEELIEAKQDFTQKDLEFHTQLAICSNNMVMTKLIPVICEGVTVFSTMVETPEYEWTLKSHREIVESVKAHRAVDAEQAMLFHLLYNRNRFLEQVKK